MLHQPAATAAPRGMQGRFVFLTVVCILFIVAWVVFWPGGYSFPVQLRSLDWTFGLGFGGDAGDTDGDFNATASLQSTANATGSVSSWTAIYTRADRASMPRQPVPGLTGNFRPHCSGTVPCISMGTGWFGEFKGWEYFTKNFYPGSCTHHCDFVSDISQADAVLFHGRDLPAKPPSWRRHPRQLWVYLNLESPRATQALGLNVAAHPAYHAWFNLTSTYESRLAHSRTVYGFLARRPPAPPPPPLPDLQLKKRLAYIVFSNCWGTFNARPLVVRRLQAVMELDVYGGCGSLKMPRTADAFQQLGKKYYFYLSFENAFCRDYITEKFFGNAMTTDAAPVAIGGLSRRDYEAVAPNSSFVYGPDFKTARELAEHLRRLAADHRAYLALFAWRARYQVKSDSLLCGTCKALYAAASNAAATPRLSVIGSNSSTFASSITTHLSSYYSVEKNCKPANFEYLV